MGGKRKNL